MPRIAIILLPLLAGTPALAQAQQPTIDPKVMEWITEMAPRIIGMLPLDASGRPDPARLPAGKATPSEGAAAVMPGAKAEQMPIWECRDIVRANPDWPDHPEMVAFMRKCGVYPPRPRQR